VENRRYESPPLDPIVVPLPVNGMITAVLSIEPTTGDGGKGPPPATIQLSSERELNHAENPALNRCFVAAQVVQKLRG